MTEVTEVRDDSGIEILNSEPEFGEEIPEEQLPEDTAVFRTEEDVEIVVDETAGHDVTITAQHFVAAAVDREADEMTQALTGEDRENYSMVHISNEDGEVGGAFLKEDGGDVEDALAAFESDYL